MRIQTVLNTLPPESFIPFDARRLAKPRPLWIGNSRIADNCAERYGWCCPLPDEPGAAYLNESVTMRAERYGGAGIGVNGGGVRCGWYSGRQIKGVGRCVLAGVGAPYWHSYGGASAREAVREAIWGEVFDAALPHGAIRVQAIITTGTTVRLRYPDHLANTTCQRALIVRPAFLRPAHYMRSVLFRPAPGFTDRHPSDVARTRAAVQSLHQGLALGVGGFEGDALPDLLGSAYVRYAEQIAAARAKRVLHGALSPSNIALDGRFVDFGTSSSVSDHGRIIVAHGCPDAWQQHLHLFQGIDDLTYYIDKYADEGISHVALRNYLREVFLGTLARRFAVELVKLSGIPDGTVVALPPADVTAAAAVFDEVIGAGNREPFKLLCPCPAYTPQMPHRMGRYHLGTCMALAADCDAPALADEALASELPDAALRQRFVAASWRLRAAFLNGQEGHVADLKLGFMRLNSRRVNAPLESLYSWALNRRIDEALAADDDMGAFIEGAVNGVADRLREPTGGEIKLSLGAGRDVGVGASLTTGLTLSGSAISWQGLRGHLPALCAAA